jgi:hypothetical protein
MANDVRLSDLEADSLCTAYGNGASGRTPRGAHGQPSVRGPHGNAGISTRNNLLNVSTLSKSGGSRAIIDACDPGGRGMIPRYL